MRFHLPSLYLTLLPAEPLAIAGGAGTEIRVLEGKVWLTEESLPEDVFLYAGTSYVLRTGGRAVLEADHPARIVLEAPVSVRSESVVTSFAHLARHAVARVAQLVRPASAVRVGG